MSSIEVEKLSAFYGKAQALSKVSLQANQGEIIAVIGANGAGKSTLLDTIMGLVQCAGTVRLNGKDVTGESTFQMVVNGIGYAPERFNLFPYMSVRDNLMVGAHTCLLYTSPSPRDATLSRMPSSA